MVSYMHPWTFGWPFIHKVSFYKIHLSTDFLLAGLISSIKVGPEHFTNSFIHQLQTILWDYYIHSHHSTSTKNGKTKTLKNIGWLVWEAMLLLELENTLGTKQKFMQRSWKSNVINMLVPNKCVIGAHKTLPTPNLHADLRKFWHQKAECAQHYLIRGVGCRLVEWNGSKGKQRKKPTFQMSFTHTQKIIGYFVSFLSIPKIFGQLKAGIPCIIGYLPIKE
jgi:hypothetical protein